MRQLPWVRRLVVDYAFDFPSLASFFADDPVEAGAWRRAIDRVQQHPRRREAIVDVLKRQLTSRGTPAAAMAAVDSLRDPRTVAVVTGQQAGLFGGPVYTALKALTAVQLARKVSAEHGVTAVAVFWVDSEDHDWVEVASTRLLDGEAQLREVTAAAPEGAGKLPVAQLRLDARIADALEAVRAVLPRTEFTDDLLARLADAYAPGRSMSEAFARCLDTCLGPLGLIVYDCADPAAKPLAAPVLAHEIAVPARTSALAVAAGEALAARGYHVQVDAHPDTVALFHLGPERQAIRIAGDRFSVAARTASAAELGAEIASHPERFSPNVLLRPLVQDTLFPTIAYVAGPSELAYLGQLREVYAHFGIPMPLVVPRVTATLLDTAATRFLQRYALPIEAMQPQDESVLNRLLAAQLPPEVDAAFKDTHDCVGRKMQALIAALPALDPTLEGAARSTFGRIEHDLQGLHGKIIHAAKRRNETLRRQFVRTRSLTFPQGHLQERTLGFVYFMNRYGPTLIDLLDRSLAPNPGYHCLLTV